ncbi:hypothetical protein GGX14DRAFT_567459 [Mycena pura]|uniref:Uncharacterized protein n=1 Tax=Mycena pura TaxID=153505 RepID=A0AAD6VHT5_9AGAR|nr:hypothetical protein GGX14DRAFT_567459 [Mycena pura]
MSRRQPLLLPPFTSFPLATSFPPPACPPSMPSPWIQDAPPFQLVPIPARRATSCSAHACRHAGTWPGYTQPYRTPKSQQRHCTPRAPPRHTSNCAHRVTTPKRRGPDRHPGMHLSAVRAAQPTSGRRSARACDRAARAPRLFPPTTALRISTDHAVRHPTRVRIGAPAILGTVLVGVDPFNAISVADKTAPIGFGPSTYPIGALVLSIQMIDIIKGAWRLPSITSSSWIISLINGNILFSLWRRWILIMISFHSFFVLKKDEKLVKPDL